TANTTGCSFHFKWAETNAVMLEHVVSSAKEVDKALLVHPPQIAGVKVTAAARRGSETCCGFCPRAPIAESYIRTTNHQFSYLARGELPPIVRNGEHFRARERPANRVRLRVPLIGKQDRHTFTLRQSVHDENFRVRKIFPNCRDVCLRQMFCSVG